MSSNAKDVNLTSGLSGKRSSTDGEGKDDQKRKKISFGMSGSKPGLQIKLNTNKTTAPLVAKASLFNNDSDSEPEEIPKEARMRMRNFGRDTPTSAGPNSFGKTKHGFCNIKKAMEKSLAEEVDKLVETTDISKRSDKKS